jgi:hypothetical protein
MLPLCVLLGAALGGGGIGGKEGELRGLLERISGLETALNKRSSPEFVTKEVLTRIDALSKKVERRVGIRASAASQTKFITFDWNAGRIGNQFATMREIAGK